MTKDSIKMRFFLLFMAQKFISVTKNIVSASAVIGASLSWTLVRFGKRKVLILQAIITIIGS